MGRRKKKKETRRKIRSNSEESKDPSLLRPSPNQFRRWETSSCNSFCLVKEVTPHLLLGLVSVSGRVHHTKRDRLIKKREKNTALLPQGQRFSFARSDRNSSLTANPEQFCGGHPPGFEDAAYRPSNRHSAGDDAPCDRSQTEAEWPVQTRRCLATARRSKRMSLLTRSVTCMAFGFKAPTVPNVFFLKTEARK